MGGSIKRTQRAVYFLPLVLGLAVQSAARPAAAADPAEPPEVSSSPADVARAHYVRGKDAAKAKQWQAALDELQAAWRIMQHFQIAGTLGWVELELGHHRDAATHLSYFLRHAEDVAADEMKATSTMLSEARAKVTELSVQSNVAGVHLIVDGEDMPWPEANAGVFVEPGRRTIEARLGERSSGPVVIHAKPGASQLLRLDLPKGEAPRAGGLAPTEDEAGMDAPPGVPGSMRKPLLVAGSVTAGIGIVGGIVFTALSQARGREAAAKAEPLAGAKDDYCTSNPGAGPCPDLIRLKAAQNQLGEAALWSFVGGGVIAVGTLVYGLSGPKRETTGSVYALPAVSSQGGSLVVLGTF
ncbi:hypothetical protein [Polyangium fumosum]|uniref:PEGA domain-containing protein n=1 Tax=Polyangium fumosum TaxID=889272 RepID=A0A4U1IZ50_9BACT|nr:hypothetical protein [Polyangium fumosum]TKC99981.1 hypothetical protein E8A74_35960 [Polyangium fumosum]